MIPIFQSQHAQAEPAQDADHANENALAQEQPHHLAAGGAERFQHSNFAGLLDDKCDQRASNAEGRDDHDKEQQIEHDILFHDQSVENRRIFLRPGCDEKVGSQKSMKLLADCIGLKGIMQHDQQSMHGIIQVIQILGIG